jgi:uncharacterized protein YceH (UPF0502 family)
MDLEPIGENTSDATNPTDSTIASDLPASPWPELSAIELRVLGCLLEKAMTTPDIYPLTLNALTNACNQKSNRDPVMTLGESDISRALDRLRHTHHLAALVHTAGSRTEKFKHTLSQVIPSITPDQAAILCELILRGPQTVGELRTRATRLTAFDDLAAVQTTLDLLANHSEAPLVVRLPREPGRREARWAHLLGGPVAAAAEPEPITSTPPDAPALQEQIDQLKEEVAALRAELDSFRRQFD